MTLLDVIDVMMWVLGLGTLFCAFYVIPSLWLEHNRKTRVCKRCGNTVKTEPGLYILACWPIYTPFTKKNQITKIERYTHGLGRGRVA